ncbi:DUF6402 family protein [Burkholderia cenocepacia]|uniref:DUF6402 family protein n=1 Tax=Burkholderia cenocepacia TaxID=95486 RepID=UPI002B2451D6|nr:DUF6402 family protein [Burkholderia cenocepacia]MEB2558741.1 DUF6402 family protein [Burkholderia cenocepacia]
MTPSSLPFVAPMWKACVGAQGCIPINTPQKISYDRLAPGETPPPKPPPPTPEQIKAQQAEAARQKLLVAQAKSAPTASPKPPSPPKEQDAEDHDKIPDFDLQDIPGAMDKIGWPVAAKLAREWFSAPKHVYNNQQNSEQPIDNTTVTLRWALRFGSVRKMFDELINENIYSEKAVKEAQRKVAKHIKSAFVSSDATDFSIDTASFIGDARQFHLDWQFQFVEVPTYRTLKGLLLTDLTAALGNFNLYAAVGRAEVSTEKFFQYDAKNQTKTYCIDAVVNVTHIYVYLKDNYSFNDRGDGNSQYLGHWNKKDMIVSSRAFVSDLIDSKKIHTAMGNSSITETTITWPYLPGDPIDKPVDKRPGSAKLQEKNVYYPVYNKSYNEWREKHNRGGDFMVYSKPELVKLSKPIQFKLETICRPSESM